MAAGGGVSQDRIEFWITTSLQATTVVVLAFFWFAAWKQARAADKLARATRTHADASRSIAAAATAQNQLIRMQLEESLRPFLYLTWAGSGASRFGLRNEGGGPALDCSWRYGTLAADSPDRHELDYEAIAPHQEIAFAFQMQKANLEGLTVFYKSGTGTACATEISWRGNRFLCRYIADLGAIEAPETGPSEP